MFLTLRVSAKLVLEGHGTEAHRAMFLCRLGLPDAMPVIVVQMSLGLALLVAGAKGFIFGIERVSAGVGISALLLSLLIVPIATELPEKINSILWIRRAKDTLAFGNITGAMVFQGTLLPAIGLLLTPWDLRREVLTGVIVTCAAALWLRGDCQRPVRCGSLASTGALVGYIALMLMMNQALPRASNRVIVDQAAIKHKLNDFRGRTTIRRRPDVFRRPRNRGSARPLNEASDRRALLLNQLTASMDRRRAWCGIGVRMIAGINPHGLFYTAACGHDGASGGGQTTNTGFSSTGTSRGFFSWGWPSY